MISKIRQIAVLFLLFSPFVALADGESVECQGNEVRVCFADGECLCKIRTIEPSDPTPVISDCDDPNDEGICS